MKAKRGKWEYMLFFEWQKKNFCMRAEARITSKPKKQIALFFFEIRNPFFLLIQSSVLGKSDQDTSRSTGSYFGEATTEVTAGLILLLVKDPM